jgi:spermidine synthase
MSAEESTPKTDGQAGTVAQIASAVGPDGEQLTLFQQRGGFVIHKDGVPIIFSEQRRSERELATAVLAPLRDRNDISVLCAGLGMGYLLAALLESPRVTRVDVVEHSAAIIEWNRSHLATLHREPPLADSRVRVCQMGLSQYLRAMRYGTQPEPKLEGSGYLAFVLDVDDGPSALSRPQNAGLYTDDGLADLEEALRPGGTLVLWSAQREQELLARLHGRLQNLAEIAVPVDVPGSAGLDYLYRGRRRAPAKSATRAQA